MRAAPYSAQQGYYSQPYQFYYTSTGRYCAYDANSGTHLIHSLKDNRWYPYLPEINQPYSPQHLRSSNRTTEYQRHGYEYQPNGVHQSGGVGGGYANGGKYNSGERNRESVRTKRTEEFLYSAAAAEAAQKSLIEDSNIGMDDFFDDEGVDVRVGERIGRPRKPSNERQRQRSRSGPEPRKDVPYQTQQYTREAGYSRNSPRRQPNYQADYDANQCPYNQTHLKQAQAQTFGSNQAGVGYEGSEHDSGYMEDYEPIPDSRKSMPGVARWLDDTPSVYSIEDDHHPFDVEKGRMQADPAPHFRRARGGVTGDPRLDKYYNGKSGISSDPPYTDTRTTQKGHSYHYVENRMASQENDHYRAAGGSLKTLHRQDSGIDMSGGMVNEVNIEIDIQMDDAEGGDIYPGPGGFPRDSPHPRYISPRRTAHSNNSSKTNLQSSEDIECYYTIPPCPDLPPPQETIQGATEMIYTSRGQELTAPHYFYNKPVSTTFRQPDSVYTESIVLTPRPKYHQYTSPAMLPRAPSPPLSPPPIHTKRTRRSGLGVPVVEYETRYTGPRWG